MEDGDEEVVWEGSSLFQHLEAEGLASEEQILLKRQENVKEKKEPVVEEEIEEVSTSELDLQMEAEVTWRLLESGLLVQEDEDFVSNFVTLNVEQKESDSLLSSPLLGPCCLVAATSSIFFMV